ncbi:MAG: DUF1761 domain-containing protein [Rubricoccaceae bacterium]|nr:DUF1761 domain-containing protein [Rubricoccaceae bacterium]
MEVPHINHFAVIAAAVANMVVGAIWYSPVLFYRAWMNEAGLTEERLKQANMGVMYGVSFIFALVIAYNLAFFLGDESTTATWGATAGFLAGFGWAAMVFGAIALFEQRSWKYILINGGYITVCFTLMGLIIGAWR